MMFLVVLLVTYASGFAFKTPRARAFLSKLTMNADKRVVIVGASGYIGYILVYACPRAPL